MGDFVDYMPLQEAINGFETSQKRWQKSGLNPDVIETVRRLARAHHGLRGVNDILEAEQFRVHLVRQETGWQCHSLSQDTMRRLYASQRSLIMFIGYLLDDLRTGEHDPPATLPSE